MLYYYSHIQRNTLFQKVWVKKKNWELLCICGKYFCWNTISACSVLLIDISVCIHAFFIYRYRAVASWSRVQGNGIPLITAIEIISIWVLSFVLAIPEAIGFVMIPFEYRGEQFRTCMFNATSPFMEVCACTI